MVKTFIRLRSSRKKLNSRLLPGEIQTDAPIFIDLAAKGISPSEEEIQVNPRSRSARLRVVKLCDEYKGSEALQ